MFTAGLGWCRVQRNDAVSGTICLPFSPVQANGTTEEAVASLSPSAYIIELDTNLREDWSFTVPVEGPH